MTRRQGVKTHTRSVTSPAHTRAKGLPQITRGFRPALFMQLIESQMSEFHITLSTLAQSFYGSLLVKPIFGRRNATKTLPKVSHANPRRQTQPVPARNRVPEIQRERHSPARS